MNIHGIRKGVPTHFSAHPTIHPQLRQGGYVIVTILVILLVTGILLSGTMRATHNNEQTAGHAIQYNRAMEAAEAGVATARNKLIEYSGSRRFADEIASDGVYSLDSVDSKWWQRAALSGEHEVEDDMLLGVAAPPRYVFEQLMDKRVLVHVSTYCTE